MTTRKQPRHHPPQAEIKPPVPATVQLSLGFDPAGKMEPRDITTSKEGWSEFNLDDGSVIRAKAVLLDVKKATGQYDSDGNPIYIMQFAFVSRLNTPDALKKRG
jgi:hypothetical protein